MKEMSRREELLYGRRTGVSFSTPSAKTGGKGGLIHPKWWRAELPRLNYGLPPGIHNQVVEFSSLLNCIAPSFSFPNLYPNLYQINYNMGVYKVPSLVADKVSPRAKELLQKVAPSLVSLKSIPNAESLPIFTRSMISSRMNVRNNFPSGSSLGTSRF